MKIGILEHRLNVEKKMFRLLIINNYVQQVYFYNSCAYYNSYLSRILKEIMFTVKGVKVCIYYIYEVSIGDQTEDLKQEIYHLSCMIDIHNYVYRKKTEQYRS